MYVYVTTMNYPGLSQPKDSAYQHIVRRNLVFNWCVYYFPTAPVTNQCSWWFQQQELSLSQFWGPEIQIQFLLAPEQLAHRPVIHLDSQDKNLFFPLLPVSGHAFIIPFALPHSGLFSPCLLFHTKPSSTSTVLEHLWPPLGSIEIIWCNPGTDYLSQDLHLLWWLEDLSYFSTLLSHQKHRIPSQTKEWDLFSSSRECWFAILRHYVLNLFPCTWVSSFFPSLFWCSASSTSTSIHPVVPTNLFFLPMAPV